MTESGNHALFAENKDFARLDVAFKHGAGRTQRAVLGGDDIHAVRRPAVAKRAEAVGVARADELLRRHQNERIGALQRVHRRAERLLYGGRAQPLPRYDVRDDLRVACGVENRAGQFQPTAQRYGVA